MKKKLRLFTFIFAVFMIFCCLPLNALADSFVVAGEDFDYFLNDEGGYTIDGYDGEAEVLEIPAYIDSVPVTAIDDYALYCLGYACKKIVIPETIKTIEGSSLTCNNYLTDIEVSEDNPYFCDVDGVLYNKDVTTLVYYPEGREDATYTFPDTVTELSEYCFHSSNIKTLTFSENIKNIGYRVFYSCDELEEIVLPQGLENIGNGAFYYCENLKAVNIPDTVLNIGESAFGNCYDLENVVIPDSVTEIGRWAFENCSSLKAVHFGAGVEIYGYEMFSRCEKLDSITVSPENKVLRAVDGVLFNKDKTELLAYPANKADVRYNMPDSVTFVSHQAFRDAKNLEEIKLSMTLERIGSNAFDNCDSLKYVDIPDSVKFINNDAFYACDGLESVYLGKSVEELYANTFDDCTSIKNFKVSEDNLKYSAMNGVLFNKAKTELIVYPSGKSFDNYVIPSTVKEVSSQAFSGNDEYYNIKDTYGKVYVGDCLLEQMCNNVSYLNVRTGTRVIGSYAFWLGSDVWGISLPEETRVICREAFFACSSLQAVYIPSGVKYIGNYAFATCNMLTDIYYGGTEAQWNKIENIDNCSLPENVTVHFESEGNEYVNPVLPEDDYLHTYEDTESGVSVSTDTDADLCVEDIKTQEIVDSVQDLLPRAKVETVYEINLQREGEEVQPEDRVLVKIPAKNRFARVYRMEEDGSLTDMNARYEEGYLWFYTDHFSYYALGMKQAECYELGDVDMDERINVKDATAVQKHLAGLGVYQQDVIDLLMDYDQNGTLNVKDATAIQKKVAGLV